MLFPQPCCQGHGAANAASREDQRFPAAGSGGFCAALLSGDCWWGERQQRTAVPIV